VSTPLIWRQLTGTLDPTRFTMPWVLKELPALSKRWRRLTGQ
jgi:DNA primase